MCPEMFPEMFPDNKMDSVSGNCPTRLAHPPPLCRHRRHGLLHWGTGVPPFWSSDFASAVTFWRVERSPRIIFIYQDERVARVSCCTPPRKLPSITSRCTGILLCRRSFRVICVFTASSCDLSFVYIFVKKSISCFICHIKLASKTRKEIQTKVVETPWNK